MSWLNGLIDYYGFDKLNSLTEYPSILTYHKLGYKGSLLNEFYDENKFEPDEPLEVTEKIDGTNMRLILTNSDYLVATRSNIVHAYGDRVITEIAVKPVLDSCAYLIDNFFRDKLVDSVYVVYGEVYGNNICEGSKVYCAINDKFSRSFRVFDVRAFPCVELEKLLDQDIVDISRFKSYSNKYWYDADELDLFCAQYKLERTPELMRVKAKDLPVSVEDTYKWMQQFKESQAIIGVPEQGRQYNQKFGKAEGAVIRNLDRSKIVKLRFEDYERTLKYSKNS